MTMLVVAKDFVGAPIVKDREFVEPPDNFVDVAVEFFLVIAPRLPALTLDFAAEHIGDGFGNALPAPARELARQLFGFGILDVKGHLPSSFLSTFLLVHKKNIKSKVLCHSSNGAELMKDAAAHNRAALVDAFHPHTPSAKGKRFS
jgi:hypothetical protein